MIIQCPSCQSRFSVDASKIKSPLTMGRCSVCGHVFTLLDCAVNEIEAAETRDRLEAERAKRARETLGDVTGMYYKVPGEEGPEEEIVEKAEEETAIFLHTEEDFGEDVRADEKEDEWLQDGEIEAEQEEQLDEIEKELVVEEDDFTPWEEEVIAEKQEAESAVESLETGREEQGVESADETAALSDIEHGGEFEESEEGGEVAEWPPPGDVLVEELEEPPYEESELEEEGEEKEEESVPEKELPEPEEGIGEGESLRSLYEEKKHFPALPVLIIILVVLILGGGGWYLYKSGMSGSSFTKMIAEKIDTIRGRTDLVLFDLKNEQEPASDGKFFAVRGFVQNKRKKPFPFVTLRIKIFDNKNNVVLTKQTVAGRVLKPEEISKMTVHDAVKQYSAMIEMNKKSSGKLGPNQKLPFLFLFDLTKFPRNKAKTFQVEILKLSK